MSTIVLDTLEFATRLKAGGFTEQQAETQARALATADWSAGSSAKN